MAQSNELLIGFFKAQLGSFSRGKLGLVVFRTDLRFSNPVVKGKDSLERWYVHFCPKLANFVIFSANDAVFWQSVQDITLLLHLIIHVLQKLKDVAS